MNQIHIYTDGGSRGNPGDAAAGWLIWRIDPNNHTNTNLIEFGGEYLGDDFTNNQAEYHALLIAIKKLIKISQKNKIDLKNVEIICHLDSELVVKQLSGEYKIKNDELRNIASKIKDGLLKSDNVEFKHVPRAENWHADRLVNTVLDTKET